MSSGDAQIVQVVSAGLIVCGLLVIIGAGLLLPARTPLKEVTKNNPVPWSPRGFGGKGEVGSSPIFGVMWGSIYTGQLFYAILLLITAAQGNVSDENLIFNQCACVYGGFLMASVWSPLFAEVTRASFVLASIVLLLTAGMVLVAAAVAKPFFVESWWNTVGGCVTSCFAGWATVAAGLSVGITTRIYNRGINSGKSNELEYSFFPLVLSVILAVLAITFANPIIPVPLFFTTFFLKGIYSDWWIFGATIVCVLGVASGTAMIFVYREIGLWY